MRNAYLGKVLQRIYKNNYIIQTQDMKELNDYSFYLILNVHVYKNKVVLVVEKIDRFIIEEDLEDYVN
jgi:hypothetical protein